MAKECMLSIGKLLLGGLPRNSVVRIADRLDMTSADYCEHEATNTVDQFTVDQIGSCCHCTKEIS